jgi:hypothetical protein
LRNPLDTKKGDIGGTRASSVYPGAKPVATDAKPKAHKVTVKAPAPPKSSYTVEMIRGSKRDEKKFPEDKEN